MVAFAAKAPARAPAACPIMLAKLLPVFDATASVALSLVISASAEVVACLLPSVTDFVSDWNMVTQVSRIPPIYRPLSRAYSAALYSL